MVVVVVGSGGSGNSALGMLREQWAAGCILAPLEGACYWRSPLASLLRTASLPGSYVGSGPHGRDKGG